MGKMTDAGGRGSGKGAVQAGLEIRKLGFRKGMEEALKEDLGFAEAGVEVVVNRIEQIPVAIKMKGRLVLKLIDGISEAGIKVANQVGKRRNFVQKLRLAGQEDFAKEVAESSRALAAGVLKIVGVERQDVGSGPEMFGMLEHGEKQAAERRSQAGTERRRHAQHLEGLRGEAVAAHAESLVEIDAEHAIGGLEGTQGVQVDAGFFGGEGFPPVMRNGTAAG